MKTKALCLFISFFTLLMSSLYAQPIPVELMAGNKFTSIDVSLSKSFSQGSKLGFFHMNTLQVDYEDKSENSFILQDLLTYEVIKTSG